MSSLKLPLRVRHGIREHWEDANTPVQKARSAVKQVLGIDVVITVMWESLVLELQDDYPDKSTLVPSVAAGVQAFLDGLREILDAEVDLEWTETLLERCCGCLRIFIGISKESDVFWASKETGLNVNLPKGVMPFSTELQPQLKVKLLQCFDDRHLPLDDWADLSVEAANHNSAAIEPHRPFDILPDISILPRPDQLLLKPPYHLAVYSEGKTKVEIQCSHSPTLELLADYLKKWCKVVPQDTSRPPAVDIKLHQSPFSLGPTYDRLTMSVEDRNSHSLVSPMIVLSFVEGVLGYKSVSVDGSSWTFRKDSEFRKRV
ncbi:hypothetical protein F4781DRAFT_395362 [Annulohypoxylon bovei var. microspora]|nr:hypothetical protein F4781DRAFT_395362 [Annulohypoxylon bovei var. microspora]